ncbi:MAG TPA: CRISPR-associated helicase Cas3' [Anaerolineaceae bacterium]|nr:CRISPR-associated helicase Cas3' [Anaerolineaceae bacterium]
MPVNKVFYAHSNDRGKDNWQPLIDHLQNTAQMAFEFGRNAGVAELAYIAGILHDLGKYSPEFQARLEGSKQRVDHSTAGAIELCKLFRNTPQEPLAVLLAYCIAGHHTGLLDYGSPADLPDDGTLSGRLNAPVKDYSSYQSDLAQCSIKFPERLNIRPLQNHWGFSFAFLTRMIFSALVDADFQETEAFMRGQVTRGGHESIPILCDRLNAFLSQFDNPQREIDRVRTETLHACISKAALDQGFFTLTVPTGGGKTLASLAFALNHAVQHGLQRIIYVIPFTTIIEQNAGVFKDILGAENILEHHSNFDWEQSRRDEAVNADNQTNSAYSKLKLAAENWDIPIVVTTNVQFFESLFASRSSRTRKLHNLARSVIIFDEAQMLPKEYLLPSMYAVRELVVNYGASAVFCTATQPELGQFLPDGCQLTELAPDPQHLFDFYRRVEVHMLGKIKDSELLERLNGHEQVLCIVNTRRHAKGLFDGLEGEGAFHLSTLMCPVHRKQVLGEIRQRLLSGQLCRVISTSVLEAGVDLDFPVGYRALAGLDSINQAAGRVNREMGQGIKPLYVFEPDTPHIKRVPRFIAQNIEVVRSVLRVHQAAPISIAAIRAYFQQLYSLRDRKEFDFKNIIGCFDKSQPHKLDFATAAQKYRIIEDDSVTIIIPYDQEAQKFIEELKITPYPASILRKLQPYTVNIYEEEFNALNQQGAILMVAEKYAVLSSLEHYHPQTGLVVPAGTPGGEALFF